MPPDMAQIAEPNGPNPFASSTTSPVAEDCTSFETASHLCNPVEVEVKRDSLKSAPRIQPAPPPRAHRKSSQSSHQSLRLLSHLPQISTDPEKSIGAVEAGRWQDDIVELHKTCLRENAAEVNSECLKMLLYLSGPVFFISAAVTVWTILGLVLAVILHPFNALSKSRSFRKQVIDFLAPALRLHLSCLLSSVRNDTYSSYSAPVLVIVNLLAPFMSIAVVLAAWTAACFWLFAAVIGDPTGPDGESRRSSYLKEDADGKETALRVRRWWRSLLIKPLR